MKVRKTAIAAALVAATVSTACGTAAAAPAPADKPDPTTISTDVLPGVHYRASIVDHSVVVTTDGGSLTTLGTQLQVLDSQGRMVAGVPLTYNRDGKDWPIAARIDGNTAVLTPSTDPADARPHDLSGLRHVDAQSDFNDYVGVAANNIGLAVGVGSLIGTVVGAIGGCVAGIALASTTLAFPPLFLPAGAGMCLAGVAAGAGLGVVAGTIIFGVPVAIASAIQFYNEVNTPPKTDN